jgi:hypothetical protein
MDEQAFATVILSWHDFFLASAGASAALLGLLFVGVSIGLSALATGERADLRARAELAFANLLYVLVVSLMLLVRDPEPLGFAFGLGTIAALGLVRASRGARALTDPGVAGASRRRSTRRLAWTVVGDLLLAYVAASFYLSGDPKAVVILMAAIFVLLIGAADVSWEILVTVSREGADERA